MRSYRPTSQRHPQEDGVATALVLCSRRHVDLLRVSSCLCHS
ncbi:putative leader peptide [Streptomyces sp. NPDC090080]